MSLRSVPHPGKKGGVPPRFRLLGHSMEEAEKRKERLRATRIEAEQSQISSDHLSFSPPVHLLNPLAQPFATPPVAERQTAPTARFDYYTDPMAAYSSSRGSAPGCYPPDNFTSPIRSCSPTAHPASPIRSCSPTVHPASPSSGGQGSPRPPFPGNHFQQLSYSSHQRSSEYWMPVPQYSPRRSPLGTVRPVSEHSPVGMPPMQYRAGGTNLHGLPRGASVGIIGASPRGYAGTVSPGSNYGRGRGSWRPGNYGNSSAGRGGRGRGSGELSSARERPELFANKMMVIDPWLGLEPVVGSIFTPPAKTMTSESHSSWLPSSIRTKKVKVEENLGGTGPKISLAQSIALAFEEAANKEAI